MQESDKITECLIDEYPNRNKIQQLGAGYAVQGDNTPILQPQQKKDVGIQFSTKKKQ